MITKSEELIRKDETIIKLHKQVGKQQALACQRGREIANLKKENRRLQEVLQPIKESLEERPGA